MHEGSISIHSLDAVALGEELVHDIAVDVGQTEVSALVVIGELFVVETECVQDRCLEVVDVDGVLGYVEP